MHIQLPKKYNGFTLIELLVVIGIIAALAIVVSVALNPSLRLKDAKDARRTADVDAILTAVHQAIVDNKGTIPSGISTTEQQLATGTGVTGCTVATGTCAVTTAACLDLSTALAKYLKTIPVDPSITVTAGTPQKTNYSIVADANNIVTVKACGVENTANSPIQASR